MAMAKIQKKFSVALMEAPLYRLFDEWKIYPKIVGI